MKVTIADVAKRAKVSKTTVSRILNGNYAHASEETIKKVLKAIEELDYSPNALAKGLKSMRTHVIGLVLSNLKNPFWTTVLEGLEDTCRDLGYHLMICNSNEDPEMEEKYLKSLRERQVDGVILNPTCKNPQLRSAVLIIAATLCPFGAKVVEYPVPFILLIPKPRFLLASITWLFFIK